MLRGIRTSHAAALSCMTTYDYSAVTLQALQRDQCFMTAAVTARATPRSVAGVGRYRWMLRLGRDSSPGTRRARAWKAAATVTAGVLGRGLMRGAASAPAQCRVPARRRNV